MINSLKVHPPRIVIFTDLDGTLLDDQTYDFRPAMPALNYIESLEIPLIPVSSKTRAEIEVLRDRMSLKGPFIAENGGGIFFPEPFFLPSDESCRKINNFSAIFIGRPIVEVIEKAKKLKDRFEFRGFSELSVDEIISFTGLSREMASRASQREFDEPIVLQNPDIDQALFCQEAARLDLGCVVGGRFIHLFQGGDKGKAVEKVIAVYEKKNGPHYSIALGDSPNDIPMLKVADKAVIMQGRNGRYMKGLNHFNLVRAQGGGPEAWNRVVLSVLKGLQKL